MAAFKDEISAGSVTKLAEVLAAEAPSFDSRGFRRTATAGLEALELKARIAHVATALGDALPGPFATDVRRVAAAIAGADLSTWEAWPAVTWVEVSGLDDPEPSLNALAAMTKRASAEFAIRPYLVSHPRLTWDRLGEWASSADLHLRRLASEGTRPRLPWGIKVPTLLEQPERGIELLDLLREDDEEYVRRSVANHLNDIGRDHQELALSAARRWKDEGGDHVEGIVRRGLRGLVKRGVPAAMELIGADVEAAIEVVLELESDQARIGDELPFAATLTAQAETTSQAVVDYAVHYARASGRSSKKVFKLAFVALEPGVPRRFERRISLVERSIRSLHPGPHALELLVNGRVGASAGFEVIGQ